MEKFESGKEYPGLSSNRVKVTYGNRSLEELIKSLIELEIGSMARYNEDTMLRAKGDNFDYGKDQKRCCTLTESLEYCTVYPPKS